MTTSSSMGHPVSRTGMQQTGVATEAGMPTRVSERRPLLVGSVPRRSGSLPCQLPCASCCWREMPMRPRSVCSVCARRPAALYRMNPSLAQGRPQYSSASHSPARLTTVLLPCKPTMSVAIARFLALCSIQKKTGLLLLFIFSLAAFNNCTYFLVFHVFL